MLNYLIVEDFAGNAVPFLFPPKVDHQDMREQLPYGKVISGGQAILKDRRIICQEGCTISGVDSRLQEDAELIAVSMGEIRA